MWRELPPSQGEKLIASTAVSDLGLFPSLKCSGHQGGIQPQHPHHRHRQRIKRHVNGACVEGRQAGACTHSVTAQYSKHTPACWTPNLGTSRSSLPFCVSGSWWAPMHTSVSARVLPLLQGHIRTRASCMCVLLGARPRLTYVACWLCTAVAGDVPCVGPGLLPSIRPLFP